MFCRFDSRRLAPRRSGSALPPSAQPLEPVLARLVGRSVTLLVGRRFVSGKLLSSNPVIVIGLRGQATVVADLVKSVAF